MTDVFLKVLSDLCLYFAVVGAFPRLFVRDLTFLLPGLCCALAGTLGYVVRERGSLRWLGLVPALASFLLGDSTMELLLLVPPVIYVGMLLYTGAYGLSYYDYRESFLKMLTGLGIFALMVYAMGYFEGMFGESFDSYDITTVLFYGAIYGFSGVFLLRQLRLGADSRREDRLRNSVQMILVLMVILVLAGGLVAAEDLLHGVVSALFYVVMAAVGLVPMVIHEFIQWFMKDSGREFQETLAALQTEHLYTGEVTYPSYTGMQVQQPEEPGFPWVFAVLVLVVLCVALVYLLRSMQATAKSIQAEAEEEKLEAPASRTKGKPGSNRTRIRKLYRSYLKQQRRQGVKLEANQTSRDILDLAGPQTDKAAAAQLRQLYLKARYDEAHIVTRQEADRAKSALQKANKL